jgi:hypothetical protein
MKKSLILMFAFLGVFALGFQTASAQLPINIPKIPKIPKDKKNKPKTTDNDQPNDSQTNKSQTNNDQSDNQADDNQTKNDNQSNDNQKAETETKKSEQDLPDSPAYRMWFDELQEAVKEAEEYTPQSDRAIYTYSGKYDWGLLAVSRSARDEWFSDIAEWRKANPKNKFDAAFDKLAALLAKYLPADRGSLASYKFRNPADEKIMKTVFEDITRYQIYSYGIEESNWLIEKNDFGIPNARYKHAVFYLRDKKGDHPYCYLTFVNIIQDYSGGGTYAASRARYIGDQLVGCPAGK